MLLLLTEITGGLPKIHPPFTPNVCILHVISICFFSPIVCLWILYTLVDLFSCFFSPFTQNLSDNLPGFGSAGGLVVFEVFLRDNFHYDFGSLATIVADIHTTN